jgi:hypothetical protein
MKWLKRLAAAVLVVSAIGGPAMAVWTFNMPYHPDQATGDILYLNISGGSRTLTSLAAGAAGTVLVSGGASTAPSWSGTIGTATGTITASALAGQGTGVELGFLRSVTTASSGTTTIAASDSGMVYANTGTSGTTTFTLPAAAAGRHYCFIESGDAGGELLINVGVGDTITVKADPATNSTAVTPAAGTGVKNTAATNAVGDMVCLVAIDATAWRAYSQLGIWASQ